MLRLLAYLTLGMAAGVVTGLLPGLHPNAVMMLLLPVYIGTGLPPMPFVAAVTGMSVVHTLVSFIPSILLAAPNGDTALAVLPGARHLEQGRGHEAVALTVYGGVGAAAVAVLAAPVLLIAVPPIYEVATPAIPILLLAVLGLVVWRAVDRSATARTILLAGTLGIVALDAPPANGQYILLPLLGGVFGLATILLAAAERGRPPPQTRHRPVRFRDTARGGVLGAIGGLVAGFLPGIGTAQSAMVVEEFAGLRQHEILVVLGGITTADLFLSLVALLAIGNPRSGAAVAMGQVLGRPRLDHIALVTGMTLIATGCGALATRSLQHRIVPVVRERYRTLLLLVASLLAGGTAVLTGWFGLVVLATATALGVHTAASGVRRSACMAVLIVPTILFYL